MFSCYFLFVIEKVMVVLLLSFMNDFVFDKVDVIRFNFFLDILFLLDLVYGFELDFVKVMWCKL